MKAIIAKNNKDFIGLDGNLPWKCSSDLTHFKHLTMGSTLLVGWKTAQTLPKLKGRTVIVYDKNNTETDYTKADWCIGGKDTFDRFCDKFTELYISHIDDDTIGDTYFPRLEKLNVNCKIYHYYFNPNK